ncbi:MAG: hypothetical protein ACTSPS_05795 [Promethearchaeota archaeon]
MVSTIGYLDGITASLILLSATIFGLLSFYHAKKLNARLLSVAGLTMVFVGLLWLGPFVDLISLLTTGKNLSFFMYSILSYMWVVPALICAMYLGSELMMPEKKKVIVGIFIVLGIIFEYFIFFDNANAFTFTLANPGEDTIDASFVRTRPAGFLILVFLIFALIFLGIGFAIKAKQATGDLRKKFAYLSLGFIIFVVCGALDSIIPTGVAIGFSRGVMCTFALWMYLGLKT